MRHIQFLSSWVVFESEGQFSNQQPAAVLWRTNGIQWSNMRDMGQANVLPDQNVCVWEAWVEDAGVALLEADTANYTILLDEDAGDGLATTKGDIASEKPKDEKPPTKDKTDLETFLKAKGVKDADAAVLCKKADANATRKQIADGVIAYCNALPKAKG